MSELAALGLASNIVQLVAFTSNLVAKGREIYGSADGVLVEFLELEAITNRLEELSSELIPPIIRGRALTENERQLRELCDGCRDVSKELLDVISSLKAQGTHKRWNSFRQALHSIWKEGEVQTLSTRLERYRRQIDTTLLVSIRDQIKRADPDTTQITKEAGWSPRGSAKEISKSQVDLIDMIQQNPQRLPTGNLAAMFTSKLSTTAKHQREKFIKSQVLEQLRFTSMGDRYERIEDAYRKTFDWIFVDVKNDAGATPWVGREHKASTSEMVWRGRQNMIGSLPSVESRHPQWNSFVQWLHGKESLYWVTGKPGSGKSTLMKYLFNDNRTLKHIQSWAGKLPIVTAGFFFWNSGTTMQMSRMGLIQTLIYEAVGNRSELIPRLFPNRWRSYELFGGDLHPWSWSELTHAFGMLVSDDTRRFLFFIDGLDEFDGNSAELAGFIIDVSSSNSNIKMCVASRPWLVFEDAFQRQPSLRLEDLTAPDIHLFVSEKLGKSIMFAKLQELQPQDAERLIMEVTDKASGVFLWVRLVVLSLLEGLQDGDTIQDLQNRLLLIPSDIEELFKKILGSLNPSYFEQASILFQLVRAADKPLSLISISFAEDGFDRAIAAEAEFMPQGVIEFRAETMRRRLSSRCKGLLEAPTARAEGPEAKVQYLHRTVKDFLARIDIWDYVLSGIRNSFDPDLTLSGAFLLHIKTLSSSSDSLDAFWDACTSCIEYSTRFEIRAKDAHISILCELDKTAGALFENRIIGAAAWHRGGQYNPAASTASAHWTETRLLVKPFRVVEGNSRYKTTSFFDFAFQYPLYSYIRYRFSEGKSPNSLLAGYFLLHTAVFFEDVEIIKLLFNYKANPNLREGSLTIWQQVLWRAGEAKTRETDQQRWAEIVEMFLKNGADPRVTVNGAPLEKSIIAAFQDWNNNRANELLSLLCAMQKTHKGFQQQTHTPGSFFKRLADKYRKD
jgi:hypothetical protein